MTAFGSLRGIAAGQAELQLTTGSRLRKLKRDDSCDRIPRCNAVQYKNASHPCVSVTLYTVPKTSQVS